MRLHSEAVVLAFVAVAVVSAVADIAVLVAAPKFVHLPSEVVAEEPLVPALLLPVEPVVADAAIASSSYQCSLPAAANVASV